MSYNISGSKAGADVRPRETKAMKTTVQAVALLIGVAFISGGCANNAQTGALVGGAGGAGVGAIAGSFMGSAGKGALIGAGAGAIGGYIVGNEVDKSEQQKQQRTYDRTYQATRPPASTEAPVSRADVVNWTRQGVKDEIIIDRIQRSHTAFQLTAADENQLRDAGVSEEVVRAMKYSGT